MAYLLSLEATKVNRRNTWGDTALLQALKSHQLSSLRLLLRHGANVYFKNNKKQSAQTLVAHLSYYRQVLVNAQSRGEVLPSDPPTFEERQEQIVTEQVMEKLNQLVSNKKQTTTRGVSDLLTFFTNDNHEHILSPNVECGPENRLVLDLAIAQGGSWTEILSLVKIGCQFSAQDSTRGHSAFHVACMNNRLDLVALFILLCESPLRAISLLRQRNHAQDTGVQCTTCPEARRFVKLLELQHVQKHDVVQDSGSVCLVGQARETLKTQQQLLDETCHLLEGVDPENVAALHWMTQLRAAHRSLIQEDDNEPETRELIMKDSSCLSNSKVRFPNFHKLRLSIFNNVYEYMYSDGHILYIFKSL